MSECKWCGKPEATQEVHDALPPGDMGAAYCWADFNSDPDSCDECDPDRLLARAMKAEARVKELEAELRSQTGSVLYAPTPGKPSAGLGMDTWVREGGMETP